MTTKLFLAGIFFLLLASCDKSSDIVVDNTAQYLVNSWTENYKEGLWVKGPMIFKPSKDEDITLFRTRNKLDVRKDGSVTYTIYSNMDKYWNGRPITVTGTWTYDPVTETFMISDGCVVIFTFDVLSAKEDRVRLDYKKPIDTSLPK